MIKKSELVKGSICYRVDGTTFLITSNENEKISFVRIYSNKYGVQKSSGGMNLEYYVENSSYVKKFGILSIIKEPSIGHIKEMFERTFENLDDFNSFKNRYEENKDIEQNDLKNPLIKNIKKGDFLFLRGLNQLIYVIKLKGNILYGYNGEKIKELDVYQYDTHLKINGKKFEGIKIIFSGLYGDSVVYGWTKTLTNKEMDRNKNFIKLDLRTFKDRGKTKKLIHSENVYFRDEQERICIIKNNEKIILTEKGF